LNSYYCKCNWQEIQVKKIAAKGNYQRLKQLWDKAVDVQPCPLDEESQARLTSTEERLRGLEIELVYIIRDLRNAIVAIEELYAWRESLPDLDVLNNIWGSFHSNSKETLN